MLACLSADELSQAIAEDSLEGGGRIGRRRTGIAPWMAIPHAVRRGMVACRVGGASFSALYRFAVWIALGGDHFQSLQPGSGSVRQAAPGHLGLHVFRRRPPY